MTLPYSQISNVSTDTSDTSLENQTNSQTDVPNPSTGTTTPTQNLDISENQTDTNLDNLPHINTNFTQQTQTETQAQTNLIIQEQQNQTTNAPTQITVEPQLELQTNNIPIFNNLEPQIINQEPTYTSTNSSSSSTSKRNPRNSPSTSLPHICYAMSRLQSEFVQILLSPAPEDDFEDEVPFVQLEEFPLYKFFSTFIESSKNNSKYSQEKKNKISLIETSQNKEKMEETEETETYKYSQIISEVESKTTDHIYNVYSQHYQNILYEREKKIEGEIQKQKEQQEEEERHQKAIELAKFFFERVNVHLQYNATQFCAWGGDVHNLQILIEIAGFDPNFMSVECGSSPLHLSAGFGQVETFSYLLTVPGIDLFSKNFWGYTVESLIRKQSDEDETFIILISLFKDQMSRILHHQHIKYQLSFLKTEFEKLCMEKQRRIMLNSVHV